MAAMNSIFQYNIPIFGGTVLSNPFTNTKDMAALQPLNRQSNVNKFEVTGKLGQGGFAVVIAVKDKEGKEYALKKPFHDKKFIQAATGVINMKELYIMACIKHPYIQNAETVFFDDPCPVDNCFLLNSQAYDRMFFLMSKANYTCHELVHQYKSPISHIKRAMFQSACALLHLHNRGIAHRDLKPGNLLCYYTRGVLTVKLTDFGMTKPLNTVNRNSLHAGTSYYRAPELIVKNGDYGLSADIWSLGCTFFEMVARKTPFKGETDLEVLSLIFACRGSPGHETYRRLTSNSGVNIAVGTYKSKLIRNLMALDLQAINTFDKEVEDNLYNPGTFDQFCDLLDKMLKVDPTERLTIDQIISHEFFSGFFVPHKMDYGIWRPNLQESSKEKVAQIGLETVHVFPEKHRDWKIGAMALANIETDRHDDRYDEELSFAIRFHGLDVYSRYLLCIEPMKDKKMYEKIAWCSGYIMSKFYLDEASYHLWDLFPESSGVISADEIMKIERLILQILHFEIYKPTCFTYLEHRSFYAALFALMLSGNLMFGRPLGKIMSYYNLEAQKLINDHHALHRQISFK